MKKIEIREGHRGQYKTYADEQSLGESHDMLVEALPGQSYIKEKLHKVNTTEVTGEALKKVSAGGKGGMASGGDARDQEKQVLAGSRVMVMSSVAQEAFDHNVALDRIVTHFDEDGKPVYIQSGEKYVQEMLDPRRASKYYKLEGENLGELFSKVPKKGVVTNRRKWHKDATVKLVKTVGRDYHDFAHSNALDASD